MSADNCDVLILGGGMVGLSIANQLLERDITSNITILDKEPELGLHSSGRNSGVLHAGLYYKPGSLKARVCVEGARRLRSWVEERGLPLNPCGKVIVPPRGELDSQLDVLAERGRANGAEVELWDANQLREMVPEARTASGRALWSPNTAVVKPISVMRQLRQDLVDRGVKMLHNQRQFKAKPMQRQLELSDGKELSYGHLFNCTGLQADRVATAFGVGKQFTLLPFKGVYWQLKEIAHFSQNQSVSGADLSVPFLGVHFTLGRCTSREHWANSHAGLAGNITEGCKRLNQPWLQEMGLLARQYLADRGGFRRYVQEQAMVETIAHSSSQRADSATT